MQELKTRTLGNIVSEDHRAASLMAKYQLDFCCKGKRTLESACQEQDIPVDELVEELLELKKDQGPSFNFDKMSSTELIQHILLKHHVFVKTESPQLLFFIEKIADKHGERHPELIRIREAFTLLKVELEQHMQKEELILFPRIKEMEQQGAEKMPANFIAGPVEVMEQEHELAGSLMARIRELTNDYDPPADACTTYRIAFQGLKAFETDLHEHVHLENNILFPRSMSL